MPILSEPKHGKPYVESVETRQRLDEIRVLIESLLQLSVGLPLKKRMLKAAIWEVASATGNFCGRYRSESVVKVPGMKIQRDHIYKKRELIEELLGHQPAIRSIIERAGCCVVSAEEHKRLHLVADRSLDGWPRYKAADIVVYDMRDGSRVDLARCSVGSSQSS